MGAQLLTPATSVIQAPASKPCCPGTDTDLTIFSKKSLGPTVAPLKKKCFVGGAQVCLRVCVYTCARVHTLMYVYVCIYEQAHPLGRSRWVASPTVLVRSA